MADSDSDIVMADANAQAAPAGPRRSPRKRVRSIQNSAADDGYESPKKKSKGGGGRGRGSGGGPKRRNGRVSKLIYNDKRLRGN
ncbi:hypothetical protein NMY22_g15032 [Coprinellus aureogranulatus]|nr:hypothetical protein NMY22_g15032 [Coprinellus aureogranulatus]